jgi:hypothetical protein
VNAGLARAVCGPGRTPDRVHDVARVMRIPATLNHKPELGWPRPVAVVLYQPDRRYRLGDLRSLLASRYPWALKGATAPTTRLDGNWQPSPLSAGDLREKAANGRIRRETLALLDSAGPAGRQSPSEADAAIAAGLIRAGLTASEALSLLMSSARGKDAVRRKGERYAEVYWQRTVARAGEWVGPVVEREDGRRLRRLPMPRRPYGAMLAAPSGPRVLA